MNTLAKATCKLVRGEAEFETVAAQLTTAERQALIEMRALLEQNPRDLARTMAAEGEAPPWVAMGER